MHELGIAEAGIRAAVAEMEHHGASRILSVTLRIGELAAVDPEALRFAFEVACGGTPAEGAALEIENVAAQAWCESCRLAFKPDSASFFCCPECGQYSGQLRQGREIELARLEMDS